MRYARGGHPYPILMAADGRVTELKSAGGLMGLFPEMECATNEVQLHPGDRVVLCTDGIESAFEQVTSKTDTGIFSYPKVFEPMVAYSATEMIPRLEEWLDRLAGSLQPADDVTVLAMEVFPDATQKTPA